MDITCYTQQTNTNNTYTTNSTSTLPPFNPASPLPTSTCTLITLITLHQHFNLPPNPYLLHHPTCTQQHTHSPSSLLLRDKSLNFVSFDRSDGIVPSVHHTTCTQQHVNQSTIVHNNTPSQTHVYIDHQSFRALRRGIRGIMGSQPFINMIATHHPLLSSPPFNQMPFLHT